DKETHQIFLEPEGLDTNEIYVNGMSTSMPIDVQMAVIASIPGLERAEMIRPGYAIEYDAVDARELDHRLEVKKLPGLFLAGQINGTSGYEEAAGQGLIAGINAARTVRAEAPVVIPRGQGYLGVLIDDLVTTSLILPLTGVSLLTASLSHLDVSQSVMPPATFATSQTALTIMPGIS